MASSDRLTRLTNIRDGLEKELEDHVTARREDQAAGRGERTTYSVGGRSVSWNEYLRTMREEISELDKLIARSSGPWEVRSRAISR